MSKILRRIFLLLVAAGLCLFAGCEKEPPVTEVAPLIVINGQEISKAQFIAAFEDSLQEDQPLTGIERQELQRSFLVQLIDRELIHGEARQLNIMVTDAEIDAALQAHRQDYPGAHFEAMLAERGLTLQRWRQELRESLIMEKLLQEAIDPRVEVTDAEIAAYYDANREQFDRPAQVRARQIVVAEETVGQEVLGLLRQGQPFAEVAAEYSLSPDSEQGGDLGFFARGEMPPEFDAVVFDLPVNHLSDLVKSEYGYHIFLVEEKRKASRLKKKDAAQEIRALLERQKRETIYHSWLQDLRARAEIRVDWSQLDEDNARKP